MSNDQESLPEKEQDEFVFNTDPIIRDFDEGGLQPSDIFPTLTELEEQFGMRFTWEFIIKITNISIKTGERISMETKIDRAMYIVSRALSEGFFLAKGSS